MTPECLILIARLCLPADTQTIEIKSHLFGQRADVQLGSARIGLIISSDEVGSGTMGLDRVCEEACVHFRAADEKWPDSVERRYMLSFPSESGSRSLVVVAPDDAQLRAAVGKLRLLISAPGDPPRYVPLSRLKPTGAR